jgi:hypothetical protein
LLFVFSEHKAPLIYVKEIRSLFNIIEDPNLKIGELMHIKISYKNPSEIVLSINDREEHPYAITSNFEITSKYRVINNIILM